MRGKKKGNTQLVSLIVIKALKGGDRDNEEGERGEVESNRDAMDGKGKAKRMI